MRRWDSSVVRLLRDGRVGVSWALYFLGSHVEISYT